MGKLVYTLNKFPFCNTFITKVPHLRSALKTFVSGQDEDCKLNEEVVVVVFYPMDTSVRRTLCLEWWRVSVEDSPDGPLRRGRLRRGLRSRRRFE